MMIYKRLLLLLLLLTVACGQADGTPDVTPTPSPVPTPTPTPAQIVSQAAVQFQALSGFRYGIARSGAPAYLDPDNALVFGRADGDFVAPDSTQATIRILIPGFASQFDLVAIGDDLWLTNFATGEWEVAPDGLVFNPSILFDEAVGLPAIMESDLSGLVDNGLMRLEEGPEMELQHISGTLDGTTLTQTSGGLISSATIAFDVWLDPATLNIHRIVLTEPVPEDEDDRVWQVDLSNFNETVTVTPPL